MITFTFPDPAIVSATTYKTGQAADRNRPHTLLPPHPELQTKPIIFLEQTHGSSCQIISQATTTTVLDTDAVLTALPNLTLAIKTADCLPIVIWHPSGVIGALHAGRQGTQQHILKKTLRLLKTQFSIEKDVHLLFGPAICESCYQINATTDEHFSLLQANHAQALEVFPEQRIIIKYADRCTAHESEFFHSYRRTGKGVPMNYTVICRTE